MESQLNLLATAATWRTASLSGLASLAFTIASGLLVASFFDVRPRRATAFGVAATAASAALIATLSLHWLPRWALALSLLGLLAGLNALAINLAYESSLQSYASRRPAGDEPGWWPEFERRFWQHVGERRDSSRPERSEQ